MEEQQQTLTNLDEIIGYIEGMNGFQGFPITNIEFEDGAFSLIIEEILEGEDWPRESSGRMWFLSFEDIQDYVFSLDIPQGIFISDIHMNEDNSITVECEQGSITVLASAIELTISDGEEVDENATDDELIADDEPVPENEPVVETAPIAENEPVPAAAPAQLVTPESVAPQPAPEPTPAPAPQSNPFLNDPNFQPLVPVTPPPQHKAPEPPIDTPIFGN